MSAETDSRGFPSERSGIRAVVNGFVVGLLQDFICRTLLVRATLELAVVNGLIQSSGVSNVLD